MRLSFIFELLLIFVLLAFAASAAVVTTGSKVSNNKGLKSTKPTRGKVGNKNRQQDANKYCSCSTKLCNCCREFNIPVVALQGPGCASLQYLKGDRLAISMSFGERVLTNTTISSRKPKPVCMPLPGGVSKFCGRVYNIGRKGTDFNACLGLELRALDEIEAAVRVSCFRFGPQGLRVEPAKPLPPVEDDDEDDDEEEDEYDEDDEDNDVDSEDYGTFSVFGDDIIDSLFAGEVDADTSDEKPAKKPTTTTTTTTTKQPARKATRKPTRSTTVAPKTQKPSRRKATTTKPTTTKTPTTPQTESSTSSESNQTIIMEEAIPSSAPHESIAAVTAMLQASPAIPTPIDLVMSSSPISNVTEIKDSETPTTTVTSNEKDDEEEKPTGSFIIKKDEDEDDEDDEDPLADAIEEELDDDSKESEEKIKDQNKVNDDKKKKGESEDVVDEIIDGVVDTLAGDEGEKKNGSNVTQASNDKDDEDDDDDDDDDDESRKAKGYRHRRFFNRRQSRDMWLERLHW